MKPTADKTPETPRDPMVRRLVLVARDALKLDGPEKEKVACVFYGAAIHVLNAQIQYEKMFGQLP